MREFRTFDLCVKDKGVTATASLLKSRGLPTTSHNIRQHLKEGDELARGRMPATVDKSASTLEEEADAACAACERFIDRATAASPKPRGTGAAAIAAIEDRLRRAGVDICL